MIIDKNCNVLLNHHKTLDKWIHFGGHSDGDSNSLNVAKREFLFNPKLYLYLDNLKFKKFFEKPVYPVLLGRSSDLAFIKEIKEVNIEKKTNINLGKTILPFGTDGALVLYKHYPHIFQMKFPENLLEPNHIF